MREEKDGHIMANRVPVKEGVFTEGPNGGVLLANRCKSCGQVFFPKAQFCLVCFQEEMEETVLNRRGTLYSYAVSHMPSTHFEPPYAVGYVDLSEAIRIFAPLKIVENKPFKVGMEMEVVIEILWQEGDQEVIGYKFRPV
jgi:uncharacterized OB-fold protein